jgi:hypothetical protein
MSAPDKGYLFPLSDDKRARIAEEMSPDSRQLLVRTFDLGILPLEARDRLDGPLVRVELITQQIADSFEIIVGVLVRQTVGSVGSDGDDVLDQRPPVDEAFFHREIRLNEEIFYRARMSTTEERHSSHREAKRPDARMNLRLIKRHG